MSALARHSTRAPVSRSDSTVPVAVASALFAAGVTWALKPGHARDKDTILPPKDSVDVPEPTEVESDAEVLTSEPELAVIPEETFTSAEPKHVPVNEEDPQEQPVVFTETPDQVSKTKEVEPASVLVKEMEAQEQVVEFAKVPEQVLKMKEVEPEPALVNEKETQEQAVEFAETPEQVPKTKEVEPEPALVNEKGTQEQAVEFAETPEQVPETKEVEPEPALVNENETQNDHQPLEVPTKEEAVVEHMFTESEVQHNVIVLSKPAEVHVQSMVEQDISPEEDEPEVVMTETVPAPVIEDAPTLVKKEEKQESRMPLPMEDNEQAHTDEKDNEENILAKGAELVAQDVTVPVNVDSTTTQKEGAPESSSITESAPVITEEHQSPVSVAPMILKVQDEVPFKKQSNPEPVLVEEKEQDSPARSKLDEEKKQIVPESAIVVETASRKNDSFVSSAHSEVQEAVATKKEEDPEPARVEETKQPEKAAAIVVPLKQHAAPAPVISKSHVSFEEGTTIPSEVHVRVKKAEPKSVLVRKVLNLSKKGDVVASPPKVEKSVPVPMKVIKQAPASPAPVLVKKDLSKKNVIVATSQKKEIKVPVKPDDQLTKPTPVLVRKVLNLSSRNLVASNQNNSKKYIPSDDLSTADSSQDSTSSPTTVFLKVPSGPKETTDEFWS